MLNLMKDGQVVGTVAEGGWVALPNGDVISPAQAGWSNGEFTLEAQPEPVPPSAEDLLQAEREGMVLSFAQMVIGLVTEGWITEADGEGWLGGALPPTVLATISLLPADQRFAAKAKATRPSFVARLDPLVEMMALAQGRSPAEIDDLFRAYATA